MKVSEVTRYIKGMLDNDSRLLSVFIRGEISNFKEHYSGHCYFTLKDSEAVLRSVMFRSRAQFLKFTPTNGLKVIAGGRITIFERDGQYQLYVEQLVPDGIGELSLAYAQLKEKLASEGLFDDERKKKLPVLPSTIGIVTSPTGAALRDIVSVSKRRHSGIKLVLYPVQVQGPEAPLQIVHAIRVLNAINAIEVIIVGRGGGSLEELWAFNDERVVRAIAESRIPVVSAVGHQTDFTLADFVADYRAATPSQAAEIVVPDAGELSRYLNTLKNSLNQSMIGLIKNYRVRLENCTDSKVLESGQDLLATRVQTIDILQQRLVQAMMNIFTIKKHDLMLGAQKLAMLSPLSVLSRGYSIVQDTNGQVISKIDKVDVGQEIEIVLCDGNIHSIVQGVKGRKGNG